MNFDYLLPVFIQLILGVAILFLTPCRMTIDFKMIFVNKDLVFTYVSFALKNPIFGIE